MRFQLLAICLILFAVPGCREEQDPVLPGAPRIVNFTINPTTICVGDGAEISFTVQATNPGTITWNGLLSSTIHGTISPSSGTSEANVPITLRFNAANTGTHQHQVTLSIDATDSSGARSETATSIFTVRNC